MTSLPKGFLYYRQYVALRPEGINAIKPSVWDLVFGGLSLIPFHYQKKDDKSIKRLFEDDPHVLGCIILERSGHKTIAIIVRR